nr:MAG TPA: hypothetical protein [Caudoviricetes sp.]
MLSHRHIRRLSVAHRGDIYLHWYTDGNGNGNATTGSKATRSGATDGTAEMLSQYFNQLKSQRDRRTSYIT